jgi:hypothetical protein
MTGGTPFFIQNEVGKYLQKNLPLFLESDSFRAKRSGHRTGLYIDVILTKEVTRWQLRLLLCTCKTV